MSHTFKYPDTVSPTTTLTFARAWFEGDDAYLRRNQDTADTKGGSMMARSYGDNWKVQPFTVRVPRSSVSETDWDDLQTFVDSIVNFAVEEFWWTDSSGNKYRVRMENEDTKPDKAYVNFIDYTFRLRILEEVAST